MSSVPRFERKTSFFVYSEVNQAIGGGTSAIVDFTTADFDLGSNFNLTTNRYTVPLDGIYHFNALFVCSFAGASTSRAYAYLETVSPVTELVRGLDMSYTAHAASFIFTIALDAVVFCPAGMQLQVRAVSVAGSGYSLLGAKPFYRWSGYRVQAESRTDLGG